MNKDQAKGKIKEMEGKAQVVKGEITDSAKDKVIGAAKKIEGKIQSSLGRAKEAAHKADKDLRA